MAQNIQLFGPREGFLKTVPLLRYCGRVLRTSTTLPVLTFLLTFLRNIEITTRYKSFKIGYLPTRECAKPDRSNIIPTGHGSISPAILNPTTFIAFCISNKIDSIDVYEIKLQKWVPYVPDYDKWYQHFQRLERRIRTI